MEAGIPIRKRMKRRETASARFITFSCQRRLPLLRNPRIADMFVGALQAARVKHGFKLYAWVVMPEHVHVLVRAGDIPLDRSLLNVKLSVAWRVIQRWKELDAPILSKIAVDGAHRFWQKGGGFDRNVRDEEEFSKEVRYIHRNPVERELVSKPEDWRWSSVRWWMGSREGEIECDPPPLGRGCKQWKGFV